MTTMTIAAHRYLAGLYECFVDKGLDTEEIRRALLTHGIKKTICQVEFDLSERYRFAKYVERHQPATARRPTLDELKEREALEVSKLGRTRMPDGRYGRPAPPAPAAH